MVTDVQLSDSINLAGFVISGTSALIAAFSATWAVVSARRARSAEEKADHYQARAEQNAERATQAAEEASSAQRRLAEAIEKQNQAADDQAEQAEGVPWQLRHREGDLFDLWNITNTTKFGVQISGPGVLRPKTADCVDGRSPVEFYGHPACGANNQVNVTWHRREDQTDEPRSWTGRKPPKP
jgi:hypothetical protein